MRVFVAGATGVVGRPLCRRLLAAGHQVSALTRRSEQAEPLRAQGIEPVIADVFDEAAITAAVAEARPDAVIHQLTAIPPAIDPRKVVEQLAPTNRLRTEGTRILLAAARAAGVRRFVAQSISFVLRPDGPSPADEREPIWRDPPGFAPIHQAVASLEAQVTVAGDLVGVALRFGSFYGPGTIYASGGSMYRAVKARRIPMVGGGTGVFSFVHVDDAAAATVCALEAGDAGVYNVVDDEPAAARDWLPYYAERIGAPPPRRVPRWLARLAAGRYGIYMTVQQRGVSNRKARDQLGWSPSIPTWRTGFTDRLDG